MRSSDVGAATHWLIARKPEQDAAHEGASLRGWAIQLLELLPPGPITLVTTSHEGVALAGAVAAMRPEPTHWRRINLSRRVCVEGPVAVVEAVELGEGVRRVLDSAFPGAPVLDGLGALRP